MENGKHNSDVAKASDISPSMLSTFLKKRKTKYDKTNLKFNKFKL